MNWKMIKRDTTPVVLGMAMIVNLIISIWIALLMSTELQRHNQSSTLAVISGFIIFMAVTVLIFWISSLILDSGRKYRNIEISRSDRQQSGRESAYGGIKMLTGIYQGKVFAVENDTELIMGRDAGKCQLIFQTEGISNTQCSIRYDAERQLYLITDYSATGIYLDNGERLPYMKTISLEKESVLQLGYTDNFMILV